MRDLLLSYAKDLDDAYPNHEFSIWSAEQLLGYFNEAICLVSAHRPDLFTQNKVIKLDPCSPYLDVCGCTKILDVLGQSDKHGNHLRPLTQRTQKGQAWQGKRPSQAPLATQLTEYTITGNLITLYPHNLDPEADLYVVVRCISEPTHYDLDSTPPAKNCAYLPAVRHWVLYNAKMVDGEFSQSLANSAREHREMFTGILSLVKQADKDYAKELKDNDNPRVK